MTKKFKAVTVEEPEVKGVTFSQFELDNREAAERRARMAQLDAEEKAARARQIALGNQPLENDTRKPFTEGQYVCDPSRSIHLPPPTKQELAETVKPKAKPQHTDPLVASLPPAQRALYGNPNVVPVELKPSIALKPQPGTIRPAMNKRGEYGLTGTELAAASAQERPTPPPGIPMVECEVCGESVLANTTFHTKQSGSTCIRDVEAARRDGIVAG